MAKGETFFIRAQVITNVTTEDRQETEIDLGAYVNLGLKQSTLMRVHGVQVQLCDSQGLPPLMDGAATGGISRSAYCSAAITTKRYINAADLDAMPQLNDDATMYSSSFIMTNFNTDKDQGQVSHDLDIAPQHLSQGYLVGVDSLFLYAAADDAWDEAPYINVLIECSLESATQSNAVALALSQQ
jgi:hypothetical protein